MTGRVTLSYTERDIRQTVVTVGWPLDLLFLKSSQRLEVLSRGKMFYYKIESDKEGHFYLKKKKQPGK